MKIWRVQFKDVVGSAHFSKISQAVTSQLNLHFAEHAPWSILSTEKKADGTYWERNYLQIYRETGMQPAHWDTGLTWFLDEDTRKPWSALSVILNINDGNEPWLAETALAGIFHKVQRKSEQNISAEQIAKGLQSRSPTVMSPCARRQF